MKKQIIITAILTLPLFTSCSAQKLNTFNKSEVVAAKETYIVDTNSHGMKLRFVRNKRYRQHEFSTDAPKDALPYEKKDQYVDEKRIAQICLTVFSKSRIEKLSLDTKSLLIDLKSDHQGNILAVEFAFAQTSSLSPQEIESLEKLLKTEIHATINEKFFKGYRYINITRFVDFKNLIANIDKAVF